MLRNQRVDQTINIIFYIFYEAGFQDLNISNNCVIFLKPCFNICTANRPSNNTSHNSSVYFKTITGFNVLLTVHHAMILGNCPT